METHPYADNTLDVALGGRSSQGWYFDNLDATWEQMYVNDPSQGVTGAEAAARVLGGQ